MSVLTNIEVQKLMCVHMFLCVCSSQEPVNKLQATHLTAAHIMKVCVCVSMCVCVMCVCTSVILWLRLSSLHPHLSFPCSLNHRNVFFIFS